ncbi:MAG TPA: TonB family protein, partial [Pyrinomonadaceae bacterium]|nr:TonB family protein [Pyrinomonadaceae bacterium]
RTRRRRALSSGSSPMASASIILMWNSHNLVASLLVVAVAGLALTAGASTVSAQQPAPVAAAVKPPVDDTARGIELYDQGKPKEAVKLLRAVTKKRKEDADAWLYLGMAYLKSDDMKKAREALQTARSLRPEHNATLNALTVAFISSGDDFGAMQVAMDAVKHGKENFEAHYLLAAVNYRIGRLPQALEGAEATLNLNPAFTPALYLKGQTLLGLSDQAQTNARNETPEVRSMLAAKSDARFAEAVQTLENFMRLAPNAPEAPKLRDELTQMRLYRDAINPSNPNRAIFAAREVTTRAIIKIKPEPLYTDRARRNQVRGMVRLRLVLGADGTVQHIYPTRRLPDGLTEAAIEAARKIKFIPAVKEGRLVSQFITIEYNFNIY